MKDFSTATDDLALDWAGEPPLVWPDGLTPSAYERLGKRMLDLIVVLASLPVTLPLILICAALLCCQGGRPFFGHRRVGRAGREFRCWKLRSMVPQAEAVLVAHLAADPCARAEWAAHQKLTADPRVTRLGRFLRQSSLDELPQILNVLRGEMSVVGPRPVTRPELARYGVAARAYLSLRPGITGAWQVGGRNAVSYDDRVAMDVAYRRGLCLRRDLAIVLKTVVTVLRRTGS